MKYIIVRYIFSFLVALGLSCGPLTALAKQSTESNPVTRRKES